MNNLNLSLDKSALNRCLPVEPNFNVMGVHKAIDRLVSSDYHAISFRIQQLALTTLSFAGMYGLKTAFEGGYVSGPAAITGGFLSIMPVLTALRMRDFENPRDLSSIRNSARQVSFEDTCTYLGWDNVFKYFVFTPEEFEKKYRSYVQDIPLKELLKTYRAADQGLIQAKMSGVYTIPSPSLWKEKLYQETGGDFAAILDNYDLEDLISAGVLSSDEFLQLFEEFFESASFVQVVNYSRKALKALGSSSLLDSTKQKYNFECIGGAKISDRIKIKFLSETRDQSLEFISKKYKDIFAYPCDSGLIDSELFKLMKDSLNVIQEHENQEKTLKNLHDEQKKLLKVQIKLSKKERLERYNQESAHLNAQYQAGQVGFLSSWITQLEILNRYNLSIKSLDHELIVQGHALDHLRDQEKNKLNDRFDALFAPMNQTLDKLRLGI